MYKSSKSVVGENSHSAINSTTKLNNSTTSSTANSATVKDSDKPFTVCALYKFITLNDFEQMQPKVREQLLKLDIRGTLLLANEGINGTISGSNKNINLFLSWLREDDRFQELDYKLSFHDNQPFNRVKVKLKNCLLYTSPSPRD